VSKETYSLHFSISACSADVSLRWFVAGDGPLFPVQRKEGPQSGLILLLLLLLLLLL
jgi:hypothetical protein